MLFSENISKNVLIHIFSPQLEHVMMSLTIIICGGILLDITAKQIKKE
jgi:hypothetical protein